MLTPYSTIISLYSAHPLVYNQKFELFIVILTPPNGGVVFLIIFFQCFIC